MTETERAVRAGRNFIIAQTLVAPVRFRRILLPGAYDVPRFMHARILSCGAMASASGLREGMSVIYGGKVEADISHYTNRTGTIILHMDDLIGHDIGNTDVE